MIDILFKDGYSDYKICRKFMGIMIVNQIV